MNPKLECVSCRHQIDAEAKICPYCGADPRTGERFDPRPLLEKHFPRRGEITRAERALDFFRQRQAIVVTVVIAVLFLAVVFLHNFITARNAAQASDVPAIPLTEVADLSSRASETDPESIPDIDFQYAGSGQRFRNLLVEPGAVAPAVAPDLSIPSPVLSRFLSPKEGATRPPLTSQTAQGDATATATGTVPTSTAPAFTGPPLGATQAVPSTLPPGATPTQVPPVPPPAPDPAQPPTDTGTRESPETPQ